MFILTYTKYALAIVGILITLWYVIKGLTQNRTVYYRQAGSTFLLTFLVLSVLLLAEVSYNLLNQMVQIEGATNF
jgi:hypothetical protein